MTKYTLPKPSSLWNMSAFDSVLNKSFIGFDTLFSEIDGFFKENQINYPPFNIRKLDENKYLIEMAVAGFSHQDLEITLDGNRLIVKGNVHSGKDEDKTLIHLGIANRMFTRTFKLSDNVVVMNAKLVNGLLKIWLESMIKTAEAVKIPIE